MFHTSVFSNSTSTNSNFTKIVRFLGSSSSWLPLMSKQQNRIKEETANGAGKTKNKTEDKEEKRERPYCGRKQEKRMDAATPPSLRNRNCGI